MAEFLEFSIKPCREKWKNKWNCQEFLLFAVEHLAWFGSSHVPDQICHRIGVDVFHAGLWSFIITRSWSSQMLLKVRNASTPSWSVVIQLSFMIHLCVARSSAWRTINKRTVLLSSAIVSLRCVYLIVRCYFAKTPHWLDRKWTCAVRTFKRKKLFVGYDVKHLSRGEHFPDLLPNISS